MIVTAAPSLVNEVIKKRGVAAPLISILLSRLFFTGKQNLNQMAAVVLDTRNNNQSSVSESCSHLSRSNSLRQP